MISTALTTGAPIVTPDGEIEQYPGVTVIWRGSRSAR